MFFIQMRIIYRQAENICSRFINRIGRRICSFARCMYAILWLFGERCLIRSDICAVNLMVVKTMICCFDCRKGQIESIIYLKFSILGVNVKLRLLPMLILSHMLMMRVDAHWMSI